MVSKKLLGKNINNLWKQYKMRLRKVRSQHLMSSKLHSKAAPAAMPIIQNEMPACDYQPQSYNGLSYENIVQMRNDHIRPNLTTYFKKPLLIHSGHMQWLFDHEGRRYLDMFGGIATISVGQCHPKVNKALEDQFKTLWHTSNIHMHPKIHEYAQRLADKFPGELKAVCFVNCGSEANDLAMLMARLHTGNEDIITLRNGYHGMSPYSMSLTAHSTWRFPVAGVSNGVHHVMNPDPYKGIWGGSACRDSPVQTDRKCNCNAETGCIAGDNYYHELEETFKYSLPRGRVAAMFAESIQGVGGTVQFPKGYIKKAAELVRTNGGLFVSDEVQTGFGRTGEHYWGFEGHDFIPDIVTLAKGIGNGFPMAAVVTTPKIAESLGNYFNTFSGNPLASAVGIAVLDVIEEEQLQKNSHELGTYFLKSLAALKDRFEIIGDVRGKGLMIGVEMVADGETKAPLAESHMVDVWETCKDIGVLLGRGGLHGNVFRIKPSMCITKSDVKFAVEVFASAISESLAKK